MNAKSGCLEFKIGPAQGNLSLIPAQRSYVVEFAGMKEITDIQALVKVTVDNEVIKTEIFYNDKMQTISIQIPETDVTKEIRICLDASLRQKENKVIERCFDFLNQAEIRFFLKDEIYNLLLKEKRVPVLLVQLQKMEIGEKLLGVLMEIITAR